MTTTDTTTNNRGQLYDQIGQLNIKIVTAESNIVDLEEHLRSEIVQDEPENELAIRQSLNECRAEVRRLNDELLKTRRTIIGRLEIEIEAIEKEQDHAPMKDKVKLGHDLATLKLEVETLRKAVA